MSRARPGAFYTPFEYEGRREKLIPLHRFMLRMVWHVIAATLFTLLSLAGGMAGFEHFESLGWRDAFLESCMLLGGMGPVHTPDTNSGKIFSGMFALYAGLTFILITGIVLTPVVHRILHSMHADEEQDEANSK